MIFCMIFMILLLYDACICEDSFFSSVPWLIESADFSFFIVAAYFNACYKLDINISWSFHE